MRLDSTYKDYFAVQPQYCCSAVPHVAGMLCCSWLLGLEQWPFFNMLAGREFSVLCMARTATFIVNGMVLDSQHLLRLRPHIAVVLHHMRLTCCVSPDW